MPAGPAFPVEAPPLIPRKTSLLQSQFKADFTSPEWQNAVQFVPNPTHDALTYAMRCAPNGPDKDQTDLIPNRDDDIVITDSFVVYQPAGGPALPAVGAKLPKLSQDMLKISAAAAVEHTHWTGVLTDMVTSAGQVHPLSAPPPLNPFTDPGPELIDGGAAQSAWYALRDLIQYLARNYQGCGVIHATPATVFEWASRKQIYWENGGWYTVVGNHYVIEGNGYTGSGPGALGAATGNVPTGDDSLHWAYAAGQYRWASSEIFVTPDLNQPTTQHQREALDRLKNRYEYIAEQTYIIWRDPSAHAATLIDLHSTAGVS